MSDHEPDSVGDQDWVLLDRLLGGELSPDERQAVFSWVNADPRRGQLLDDLRRLRQQLRARPHFQEPGAAWDRLRASFGTDLRDARPTPPGQQRVVAPRRLSGLNRWINWSPETMAVMVASVAVVVLGLGVVLLPSAESHRMAPADSVRTYRTGRGERGDVLLPDGSRVSLAPNSEITVGPHWLQGPLREVQLRGEAYFDVVHDARQPFTVHAGNTSVRDLGTRFTLRAYDGDSDVEVVLVQGRALVRADGAEDQAGIVMSPGMLVDVALSGRTVVHTQVDTARYVAFTRGRLVFDRTPVLQAARDIERLYDIDIRLADPRLGEQRISGTISEQTLPALLEQLALTLNVHVSREGRVVSLSR